MFAVGHRGYDHLFSTASNDDPKNILQGFIHRRSKFSPPLTSVTVYQRVYCWHSASLIIIVGCHQHGDIIAFWSSSLTLTLINSRWSVFASLVPLTEELSTPASLVSLTPLLRIRVLLWTFGQVLLPSFRYLGTRLSTDVTKASWFRPSS